MPQIASITSGNISAGNLKFGEMAPIEFAVASERDDVIEVLLASGNLLRNVRIDQTESGRWEIRGDLDVSELLPEPFEWRSRFDLRANLERSLEAKQPS